MEQIDAGRRVANAALERFRAGGDVTLENDLRFKRDMVEGMLRKWWAQGCREVR
jgi:hypothetical protein